MNKIFLSGNLGKDPEAIKKDGKTTGCSLSVATCGWNGETDWHKVKVWGKSVDFCLNYLKKGSGVNVVGSIRYGTFEAKDGTVVSYANVIANEIEFAPKAAKSAPATADVLAGDEYTEDLF